MLHRASTPSHRGISDDIWKPGGSIDRNHEVGDDGTDVGSGWSVANDNSSPAPKTSFVNSNPTAGGKETIIALILSIAIIVYRSFFTSIYYTQPRGGEIFNQL